MLLLFKIQTYLYTKGKNEASEAVVGADDVKWLCHQRLITRVDIDDYRSRGVKGKIFLKLLT